MNLVKSHREVFNGSYTEFKDEEAIIKFKSQPPESCRYVPLQPNLRKIMELKVQKLLDAGRVSKTSEKANCSLMLVPKPVTDANSRLSADTWRLVNDLVRLNKHVEPFEYHTPCVKDLLHQLRDSRLFIKLDLPDAYFLLKIKGIHSETGKPQSIVATCPSLPFNIKFNNLPQGLTTAGAIFQSKLDEFFIATVLL